MNNKPKNGTITLATYPDMFLDNDCKVENENYDNEFREFTVPLGWAVEWMKSKCNQTLNEFLDEYTWDETIQMYDDARHQNVLYSTEILTV